MSVRRTEEHKVAVPGEAASFHSIGETGLRVRLLGDGGVVCGISYEKARISGAPCEGRSLETGGCVSPFPRSRATASISAREARMSWRGADLVP